MKFCTKCGKEVKEEQIFCTSCGNNLEIESTNEIQSTEEINSMKESYPIDETNSAEESHPIVDESEQIEEPEQIEETIPTENHITFNRKLTKKSKIVIAIVTVFIVAIVAIVQVGNSLSDPKKLETRFESDVVSNNSSDLASIMHCSDARLTVNSKSVAPLLAYFKTNPSYYEEVIKGLNNDILNPNTKTSNILCLSKIGKKFLIFPNYKINIKPTFVTITAPVKDVTFSINNVQIGKTDTDKYTKEFGPYIPGEYSILAKYKGKYLTLNQTYPVDLVAATDGIAKLSVFDDMNYLNISSDYQDAKIFVNGKDVNVTVKDATNFGPVDSSTKIYATHLVEGKILKSEEYSVAAGDTDINLSFADASSNLDDIKGKLDELLNNYTSCFTQAVNTNDISLIVPYVNSESDIYKLQQSYIPTTYAAGVQESIVSDNITAYNISDDKDRKSVV